MLSPPPPPPNKKHILASVDSVLCTTLIYFRRQSPRALRFFARGSRNRTTIDDRQGMATGDVGVPPPPPGSASAATAAAAVGQTVDVSGGAGGETPAASSAAAAAAAAAATVAAATTAQQQQPPPPPQHPHPEHKLFVGMLPRSIDETHVRNIFSPYGEITEVFIIRDQNGNGRGCAFLKVSVDG
jgi:hypothetical protein